MSRKALARPGGRREGSYSWNNRNPLNEDPLCCCFFFVSFFHSVGASTTFDILECVLKSFDTAISFNREHSNRPGIASFENPKKKIRRKGWKRKGAI